MSKQEGSIGRFFLGIIAGVLGGTIVGLLMAPKSGKETREDLANKSKEFKDLAKDKLDELQEVSKDKMSRVASTIHNRASVISTKLDELSKRGSDVLIQNEIQ